jgi:hypothetical protein
MNCKPGDLAIVVSTLGHPACGRALGAIVRVVRAKPPTPYGPHWEVDHPFIDGAADRCLRPIRDPGDDAQDESFRWAPAPKKVLAEKQGEHA